MFVSLTCTLVLRPIEIDPAVPPITILTSSTIEPIASIAPASCSIKVSFIVITLSVTDFIVNSLSFKASVEPNTLILSPGLNPSTIKDEVSILDILLPENDIV